MEPGPVNHTTGHLSGSENHEDPWPPPLHFILELASTLVVQSGMLVENHSFFH
ncbi:MAG: hypothetical protein K9N55_17600 [Phycisphaerae bacterium]|nr:hypothetical protein [Phycisphaerae bacterium]